MGTIVSKADDLDLADGVDPPAEPEETVVFSLDHTDYWLELTADHAADFRAFMRRYTDAAQKVGTRRITVPGGFIQPKRAVTPREPGEPGELDEWYRYQRGDSYAEHKRKKAYRQAVRLYWRELGNSVGDVGVVPRAAYVSYAAHLAAHPEQAAGTG